MRPTLLAHAKWFAPGPHPAMDLRLLDARGVLVVAIGSLVALGGARWSARRLPLPDLPGAAPARRALTALAPRVPALAAGAVAASLAALTARGWLLAPEQAPPVGPAGPAALAVQGGLAVWLASRWRPAVAAGALAAAVTGAAAALGPVAVAECAYLLGAAALIGTGPAAGPAGRGWRVIAARAGLGLSLIVGALTEKLGAPALGAAAVRAHPGLNPFPALGADLPADTFVHLAGLVEVALGVALLTGVGARLVAGAAGVVFVAAVPVVGGLELVGHLPIYGCLVGVAALAPDPVGASEVTAPDPHPRRRARRRPAPLIDLDAGPVPAAGRTPGVDLARHRARPAPGGRSAGASPDHAVTNRRARRAGLIDLTGEGTGSAPPTGRCPGAATGDRREVRPP